MVAAKPTKHSLPSFIYDAPDRDIVTLLKALCAEYFCMTCFLFFTIGTISSQCHTADLSKEAGAPDRSLTDREYVLCTPCCRAWPTILSCRADGGCLI